MAITVSALTTTPVKGMRVARGRGDRARTRSGARGDRVFYVIDERGR